MMWENLLLLFVLVTWCNAENRVALMTNSGSSSSSDSSGVQNTGVCAAGSVRSGDKCYYIYPISTYINGMNGCIQTGGRFATFHKQNTIDDVSNAIAPMLNQGGHTKLWIGLRHSSGKWRWEYENTNQNVNYHWEGSEKNDYATQKCATTSLTITSMKWSSYSCDDSYATLCEKEPSTDTDHCASVTCPTHSTCVQSATSAQCACDPGYTPKQSNTGLQCSLSKVCQASGDPHYTTWDGARHHYQGLCRHLLTGVCGDNVPAALEHWEVRVNNIRRPGRRQTVSYTEYAEVSVYGHVVRLGINNDIWVDGLPRATAISLDGGAITIDMTQRGELYLLTDFGLSVTYKHYRVTVVSPTEYANHVCGLCGDWDANRQNDYSIDLTAYQEDEFVGVTGCEISTENPTDTCDAALLASAQQSCTQGIHDSTNLEPCRGNTDVNFADFYEDCVEDICAGGDSSETVCITLEALAAACEDTGTPVDNQYRIETNCNLDCPANSVYNQDMSLDVETCQNPNASYPVSQGNGEGCECMDGYIRDGSACIPPPNCGCIIPFQEPVYIKRQEMFISYDCTTIYYCDGSIYTFDNGVCVEHASCIANEDIGLNNCHCDQGYSGNGYHECELVTDCTEVIDGQEVTMVTGQSMTTSYCSTVTCTQGQTSETMNCVTNADCNTVGGAAVCQCRDGYTGDGTVLCELITSCEYDGDGNTITMESGSSLINSNCNQVTCTLGEIKTSSTSTCVDHATCDDGQCDCDEGYSGDGDSLCTPTSCTYTFDGQSTIMQIGDSQMTSDCVMVSCTDAQISESQPQCVNNAECNLVRGSYTCECEDGYSGEGTVNCAPTSCQYTDNDVPHTLPNGGSIFNSNCEHVTCDSGQVSISDPDCPQHSTCTSGQCNCDDGYEDQLFNGELICELILECFYTVDTEVEMQNGSTLTNSQCQTVTCTDGQTTEGDVLCGANAECDYLSANSYGCVCESGHTGNPLVECTPIVVCEVTIDGNTIELQDGESVMNSICQEVVCDAAGTTLTVPACVDHAECIPVDSDQLYECNCEDGYTGQGDTLCILDECVDVVCPENGHCVTGICECKPGFTAVDTAAGLTCVSSAICQATGDPHYTTWDGVRMHYQGMCRHLLSGVCGDTTLEEWSVVVNNIRLIGRNPSVSYTEYAEVTVYGHVIRLAKDRVLIIDDVPTTQNYVSLEGGKIVVRYAPRGELRLQTDFGLMVRQRGFRTTLKAPAVYANLLCGICGDWDGNRGNDEGRDLSVFQEPESVGQEDCDIPTDDPTDDCTPETLVAAENTCNLIFNLTSLVQCTVLPDSPHLDFFDDCVDDICAGGDPMDVVCETLEAFVVVCEELTETVINGIYRLESGCGYNCPANSIYRDEMDLDQATCDNPNADYDLDFNSGEGCECEDGFVFEGDECVEEVECGCPLTIANPAYLPRGTSYLDEDCTTLYECDDNGNLNTTEIECADNASCVQNEDFINECVCDEGYTGDGFVECEEDDEGNGDPHFIVTSHDQYHTKLCYDVNGNDGDVLLIVRDEEMKLEINGKIYQRKMMKHPQAYFSDIAIFYGNVKVIVSRTNITINDEDTFTWADSFAAPLSSDQEASVSSGRVPMVEIDLSADIHLKITRTKTDEGNYFLGIMIPHSEGLSGHTTGVMGSYLKSSFKPVTSSSHKDSFIEFLDRSLIIPVQKVQRYSRVNQGQVDCWHYIVNTHEIQDDLLGHRETYTVPSLDYKPF